MVLVVAPELLALLQCRWVYGLWMMYPRNDALGESKREAMPT